MKIGLVSDIHGNLTALEACLEHMRDCDRIICLGDIVNPTLQSKDVWNLLNQNNIPIMRGNHEDYFRACFNSKLNPKIDGAWFQPTRVAAAKFGKEEIEKFADLPFDMKLEIEGHKLYFCHASAY